MQEMRIKSKIWVRHRRSGIKKFSLRNTLISLRNILILNFL